MMPGPSHETKHCIQCNRTLGLQDEQVKTVRTSDEVAQFTAKIEKPVQIGDTFCNSCRIQITRGAERNFVCIQCNQFFRSTARKKILTEKDIGSLQIPTDKPIRIGDIICNKCRISSSRSSSAHRKGQRRSADTTTNESTHAEKRQLQLCLPKLDVQFSSSRPSTRSINIETANVPASGQHSKTLRSKTDNSNSLTASTSNVTVTLSQNALSESSSQSISQGSSVGDPTFRSPRQQSVKPQAEEQYVVMPFKRPAASHGYCCICGGKSEFAVIPFAARLQLFIEERIYIPAENRCCRKHFLQNRLYTDEARNMPIISSSSQIPASELTQFLDTLSVKVDETLLKKIGEFNMSEERLHAITGYTWENIIEVRDLLTSMRKSHVRDITQALVVFLFKLRSGNSNATIASILGIQREQSISEFVSQIIRAYEVDILDKYFGIGSISREDLIANHTTEVVKGLLDVDDKLVIICDGTYLRHEKSGNNYYQRKSYSGQKKTSLCKPFTICATDGYIIDILGPFYAVENDAVIMKEIMADPTGLSSMLEKDDVFVLDRGFRDAVSTLEEKGFEVMMPALKGKNKQLTCEQSNHSRIVTKIRWPVESVHGNLAQKKKLLHHQFSNKLLPKARSIIRIAGYMYNKFCRRLGSDGEMRTEIINRMNERKNITNELSVESEEKRWSRRKTLFQQLSADRVADFPQLTIPELKLLFTGTYQLKQALSYLSELMRDSGDLSHVQVGILKETMQTETLQFIVQSRHINSRQYRCYVRYAPNVHHIDGIQAYVCECANGNRTIGTCSHVAALIYYLSHGRYQARIVQPSAVLNRLFERESVDEETVINEDSDDD